MFALTCGLICLFVFQSQQAGVEGSHARELSLEKDLDEAHKRIVDLRTDKASLENSVKELQHRLTLEQARNGGLKGGVGGSGAGAAAAALGSGTANPSLSAALLRGEREKELENQLLRAKSDKDKAVRVIINLVGKDRMVEFLNRHAGSPDILDAMVETFASPGSGSGAVGSPFLSLSTPPSSPGPSR